MTITIDGKEEKYEILTEFPFDSTRKRMSVIVQKDNHYYLLTKGADNIMRPRINWNVGEKEKVYDDLQHFAVQGLRTLVMAQKEISGQVYNELKEAIEHLESSNMMNKDDQIFDIYDQYEMGLTFIGASAIEDKLQKNVASTISILMEANIRVWVLTGDKQETAIEIAKACQLIQEDMIEEILTIDFDKEKIREPSIILQKRINEILDQYGIKCTEDNICDIKIDKQKKKLIPFNASNQLISTLSIVIDGPTLGIILGDEVLEFEFFKLAIYAKSVIC